MSDHDTTEEAVRRMSPVSASEDEQGSMAALRQLLEVGQSEVRAFKLVSPTGEVTDLPESARLLLQRTIVSLAQGDAVIVVPVESELTTQQAADLLNVSRQYLVRLLDDGRIPHHRAGTHRRVRVVDVVAYKRKRDSERVKSLDELSQLTQDFGGYDELAGDG